MRIVHLTQRYFPVHGGVEVSVHEICKRLVQIGFDVSVICEKEKDTDHFEIIEGVKVYRVYGFELMRFRFGVLRIAPKMFLHAFLTDADIVHVHANSFWVAWIGLLTKKPKVITIHNEAKHFPFGDFLRTIPIQKYDRLIATTLREKTDLIKRRKVDPKKITYIPMGVTIPPRKAPKRDFPKTILCLARLDIAHKGQDTLLKSMPQVLSNIPDAKLLMVGNGNDLGKLQILANELNVSKSVNFMGAVDDSIKALLLQNCSLLCVPPRTEIFGLINLEAMAYGLPIVTTHVGGIQDIVNGAALLVEPDNPLQLSEALIKLLTNERLAKRLSKKGLEHVRQYDWNKIVLQYIHLYEDIKRK